MHFHDYSLGTVAAQYLSLFNYKNDYILWGLMEQSLKYGQLTEYDRYRIFRDIITRFLGNPHREQDLRNKNFKEVTRSSDNERYEPTLKFREFSFEGRLTTSRGPLWMGNFIKTSDGVYWSYIKEFLASSPEGVIKYVKEDVYLGNKLGQLKLLKNDKADSDKSK